MRSGERPLVLSGTGGSTQTLPGSAMGTPAYMSPEQAQGALERLGPRSDVYSLGGTLYSALTGKPPFQGDKVAAVLAAVQKGDFSPPRKLEPSIDKALEAICLKAMALQPEDRYETARALAEEIELWLGDAAVAAYPERPFERLGRWLRQHRTWTFAAAACLIGISLAATVAATLIEGGRRREESARKEAQSNFNMAQTAVEDYLTSVSQNTLLKYQNSVDIRSLRQDLLKSALTYYQRFVSQRNDDPNLRRQLANAYFRVGEITLEIDSRTEAMEAFRKAQVIWQSLAAGDPKNHELAARVAHCGLAIGKQRAALGDLKGAMASLQEARTMLEPLAARKRSTLRDDRARLADCYSEIGAIQGRLGVWRSRTGNPAEGTGDPAGAVRPISGREQLSTETGRIHQCSGVRVYTATCVSRCHPLFRASARDMPVAPRPSVFRAQAGQAAEYAGPHTLQCLHSPHTKPPL